MFDAWLALKVEETGANYTLQWDIQGLSPMSCHFVEARAERQVQEGSEEASGVSRGSS